MFFAHILRTANKSERITQYNEKGRTVRCLFFESEILYFPQSKRHYTWSGINDLKDVDSGTFLAKVSFTKIEQ